MKKIQTALLGISLLVNACSGEAPADGVEASEGVEAALTGDSCFLIDQKAASAGLGAPITGCTAVTAGGFKDYASYRGVWIGDAASVHQAHVVQGLIRGAFESLGGVNSFLGYPTTDELDTAFSEGKYNNFFNPNTGLQTAILWHGGATAAFEIHGCNKFVFNSLGSESAQLGYPTSRVDARGNGQVRDIFEFGGIFYRDSGRGCLFDAIPVMTNVNPRGKREISFGFPSIQATFVPNQIGSYITVSGRGFTPNASLQFYVNNPDFRSNFVYGQRANVVSPDGTFNFTMNDLPQSVGNGQIFTFNGSSTVQVMDSSNKTAIDFPLTNRAGFPYTNAL